MGLEGRVSIWADPLYSSRLEFLGASSMKSEPRSSQSSEVGAALEAVLFSAAVEQKLAGLAALKRRLDSAEPLVIETPSIRSAVEVVFPEQPQRVPPKQLKRRSLRDLEGLRVFLHAVAHIEFNAIHLALDAVYRYRAVPEAFGRDWLAVALDEGRHFQAVVARLESLGSGYGAYPAHGGLWELAIKTEADVLARLAIIPRVMEARGLDVAPAMIEALEGQGDQESAALLAMILQEEVAHVAAGSRWFKTLAKAEGHDPEAHYFELIAQHLGGAIRGPLNWPDRRRAGFSEQELSRLQLMADQSREIRIPPGSAGP